jgi:hypothetical protein
MRVLVEVGAGVMVGAVVSVADRVGARVARGAQLASNRFTAVRTTMMTKVSFMRVFIITPWLLNCSMVFKTVNSFFFTTLFLFEPPDEDPHARWCERGRLITAPYSFDVNLWHFVQDKWQVNQIIGRHDQNRITQYRIITDRREGDGVPDIVCQPAKGISASGASNVIDGLFDTAGMGVADRPGDSC